MRSQGENSALTPRSVVTPRQTSSGAALSDEAIRNPGND